jgi:uncharacterized protein (DUF983 family)
MYKAACPGCGADVAFKSAASVLSVCEYCQTTVLRTDEGVRDLGKRAALFEDYSPIQLGTSGVFENTGFTVVGRIQMRYEAGFWNEWYILFDDMKGGWLSDASGQYTVLKDIGPKADAPAFGSISPGDDLAHLGKDYVCADVRVAQAAGFDGELPFALREGWTAHVADFRHLNQFLTLDYSDSETPHAFQGKAIAKLADLKAQHLRDDDTVKASAGRLRAPVKHVPCPNCGSSLAYVDGVAAHMHCGSCGSEVSCTGEVPEVLAKNHKMKAPPLTLQPGDEGMLFGSKWLVLGAMSRKEEDGGEMWTEYLLYNVKQGFQWLVETSQGWTRTDVLDNWPRIQSEKEVHLGTDKFKFQYEYEAEVVYVVGAFNWKAQVGDVTTIYSYAKSGGQDTLDAEQTDTEFTWSRSRVVPTETVLTAFNRKSNKEATSAAIVDTSQSDYAFLRGAQLVSTVILVCLLVWALATNRSIFLPFVGLGLTWGPFMSQAVLDLLEL